ncbi:MAG: glycerol-3-phosphate 1-O-acyltransferase PlsY [Phycisphaerae bacterium]|nr:glycerol-3-phosphate 1-O-acyltransferase PlsY [Phycisphaerae bacterium]
MDNTTILISFLIAPLLAYAIGSISFAIMVGKLKGIDIRKHGSGNLGSTNVTRVLGQQWGIICFFGDVLKGLIPTLLMGLWLKHQVNAADVQLQGPWLWSWLLVAGCCVIGHVFPFYLKFKGGKGVATSLGILLGLWPYLTFAGLATFIIWAIIWAIWRYVSLASIVAAVAFPLIFTLLIGIIDQWTLGNLWPLLVFALVIGSMVIIKHRSNISRLIAGTENGGRKK